MEDSARLSAAQQGDREAFRQLTDPYRRELTAHCYRMLGSLADAEDVLQDVLLRAWEALARFEGKSSVRSWLYKIATNACLDALAHRRVRSLPHGTDAAGDPSAPLPPPATERAWIEPLPPDLALSTEPGPEARMTSRESVALAFLALLQMLPPRQRAAVVLRDVLGFSAVEASEMLDMTVPATNSALQRGRETLENERGRVVRSAVHDASDSVVRELVARFVLAWEAGDASAVVAVLTENAVFSMPPLPLWFEGRTAIAAFLGAFLFRGDAKGRYRTFVTSANGAPAIAVYERRDGAWRPSALDVFEVDERGIHTVVAFLGMDASLSFERFGVPATLDGPLAAG